ncbi:MAG: MATE family efflux transporter [Coxiellaceae bacterium]|nr:MATE family efflux transporter [Coxiellaceae bacterium]
MQTEDTSLLRQEEHNGRFQHFLHAINSNKTMAIKVATNAIGTSVQAANTTANAKQFTAFDESAVATKTTTSQSLARNVPGGALLAIAQYLAELLGKFDLHNLSDEQRRVLRDVMIAAYALNLTYTLISAIAYAGCIEAYNDPDTTNYLLLSGAASWPTLALGFLGPVVFSHGHWLAAMSSAVFSRAASVGGSYLFSEATPEGVLGISIGNAVGPWLVYGPFILWMMLQPTLQHLRIKKIGDEELALSWLQIIKTALKKYFWPLILLSLKIGSQRAAEWVNLWIVAKTIGAMDKNNLTAAEPATQLLSVLNLFSQGIGIAVNLILKTLVASLKRTDISQAQKEKNYKKIQAICYYALLIPTIAYAAIAVGVYFWRTAITHFFLTPEEIKHSGQLAETLLWISGTSLPADAIRLITSGALNAFGQMVTQNTWSLLLMTAFGVPVSLLSLLNNDNDFRVETVFAVRSLMILAAGLVINVPMLWRAIAACKPVVIDASREEPSDEHDTTRITIESPGILTRMARSTSQLLWQKEADKTNPTEDALLNNSIP